MYVGANIFRLSFKAYKKLKKDKMKHILIPNKLTWDKNFKDKNFGSLTPIEMAGTNKKGETLVKCSCKCGKIIDARGTELRNGKRHSCGCAKTNGFRRAYPLSTSNTSTAKTSIVAHVIPAMLEYKNLPMRPPGCKANV